MSSVAGLLEAARSDPDAPGRLLDSCRDYLAALARDRAAPARHWLTDSVLVQDTLLAACQHFVDFRGTTPADLARWLGIILRRLTATRARTAAGQAEAARVDDGVLEALPGPAISPDDEVAGREQSAAVRAVVEDLPDDYRTALDLKFRESLSFEEIGLRMGRSPEAARKLCMRALGQAGGRLRPFR